MKKYMMIVLCLVMALVLIGCAANTGRVQYIGAEKAKTLATEAAGYEAASVVYTDTDLDSRNGMDYYEVEFTAAGVSYGYCIDALTGIVIDHWQSAAAAPQPSPETVGTPANTSEDMLSLEQAREIALEHAGITADGVSFIRGELDRERGRQVYEIEFYTADFKEYDYEIDAYTGEILGYDYDAEYYSQPAPSPDADSSISEEEAMDIALVQVPGAGREHICRFECDYEDGRRCYEGKIIYDGMEYEFEIDGYSGAICGWEAERHRNRHGH